MALTDFQTLVASKVRDSGDRISAAERDLAIALAVLAYGRRRPRRLVADLASDGSSILALPPGWDVEDSAVESIETPPEQVPPARVERWHMIQRPDSLVILLCQAPPAGQVVRVAYTAPHQVDEDVDTIPAADRDAVASLAAAELLDQMAAAFAAERDPLVASADSVSQASRSRDFAALAKALRRRFEEHLAATGAAAGAVAASATAVLPSRDADGRPYLNHGRGRRS